MTTRGYGDRWWEQNIPADLEKTNAASAASASSTSKDSYTKTIKMSLVRGKEYKFWFKYKYEDPETKEVSFSDSSPIWKETFAIPNLTKGVLNLVLTAGYKSYGVKFDIDPTSVQEDIVIYESLTSTNIGNEVYRGTSTNVTIPTNSIATRWITVRTRDKWDDLNKTDTGPLPVTPLNPDPDTSITPPAPTGVSVNGSIDAQDKSGFSIKMDVSWTARTETDTNGYVIRWSPNNPSTTLNPLWEYGQVDGKATNNFTITGLTPNTVYYWQVTSKSPFNGISWDTSVTGQVASGSFGPISDPNAPDGNTQLRSIISIGGKLADLFKIGTGITQSINTSTTITPSQVPGTYNGIILDRSTTNFGHNYWLNTGQFRVGSASSFLYWDGANVYTTGKINATGGSFTGDIKLDGGTLFAGALPNSGQRVRLNNSGIFAYNSLGTQTFSLDTAGYLNSTSGLIGGWNLGSTTLSNNGVVLDSSAGQISVGSAPSNSVYLSSTGNFRIWAGSQSPTDAAALFKVGSDGTLYATGAQISGPLVITSGSTYDSIVLASSTANSASSTATAASNTATSASNTATAASNAASTAQTRADQAYNQAVAAGNSASVADGKAVAAADAAALKMAAGDINTVLGYNTTIINGDRVTTGTIDVARLNITGGNTTNGFAIDGNGIRGYSSGIQKINISSTGTISLRGDIYAESGNIGGFDIGSTYGDLTAQSVSSVRPRIIFGDKILMGWISSSNYGLRIGNDYDTTDARFIVNTANNVFRASIDTTATSYAFEARNGIRARDLYYITSINGPSSSRRFKENISYAPERYYERILNIKPAFFKYVEQHPDMPEELSNVHSFGIIAEELEEAGLGYFVQRNMNGEAQQLMNSHELAWLLIPIVKTLKEEVAQLKSRLDSL